MTGVPKSQGAAGRGVRAEPRDGRAGKEGRISEKGRWGKTHTHPANSHCSFPESARAPPPDPALVRLSGPGAASCGSADGTGSLRNKAAGDSTPPPALDGPASTSILSPALLAPLHLTWTTSPFTSPAAAWGSGGSRSVHGKSGVQGRKVWREAAKAGFQSRGRSLHGVTPRKHRIGGCDSPAKNTKACEYLPEVRVLNEEHHIPCAPTSAHHSEHVSQKGA